MAKGTPLIVAGTSYASKADVLRECTRILNNGPIDSMVCGAESEFVEELWLNRPDKHAEHPGKKVIRFERRWCQGKENWTRCFWAVFSNEDATDFSFKKAVDHLAGARRILDGLDRSPSK